jgi:small subunit ribosomal protein S6
LNKYELGVIVRADLEEEAFRAEMERVKGLVDRFGGTIEKVDEWGRRKLAYPILKLTEGMYTFITYSSESDTPNEIEGRLRLMENVLRFLTVRKDEDEAASKQKEEPEAKKEPEAEPVAEATEEPAGEEPVLEPAEEPDAENVEVTEAVIVETAE